MLRAASILAFCLVSVFTLTVDNRKNIWDFHIKVRESVYPPAANMMFLRYSMELEHLAKKWVQRCEFKHPNVYKETQYKGLGQNLAMTGGFTFNIVKLARLWSDEEKYYNFKNRSCAANKVCGHYTQMVWAESSEIGCATHYCKQIKGRGKQPFLLAACQYKPAGNVRGWRPYKRGKTCSQCPVDYACSRGQCKKKRTSKGE